MVIHNLPHIEKRFKTSSTSVGGKAGKIGGSGHSDNRTPESNKTMPICEHGAGELNELYCNQLPGGHPDV